MGDAPLSRFEESDGRLRITGELHSSMLETFGERLEAFVENGSGDLEIDLTDIRYVSSSFIGYLARTLIDANAKGCSVRIVANDRLARLLKIAGIQRLAPIDID